MAIDYAVELAQKMHAQLTLFTCSSRTARLGLYYWGAPEGN